MSHANQVIFKLEEYKEVVELLNGLVPTIGQLLCSKNSSDVVQSIRLLVNMKEQGIEASEQGV